MTGQPDAIIIGTGVIGTAIAFEMAKAGWKTLSLAFTSSAEASTTLSIGASQRYCRSEQPTVGEAQPLRVQLHGPPSTHL